MLLSAAAWNTHEQFHDKFKDEASESRRQHMNIKAC